MVTEIKPTARKKIIYPESDGKPMADNTEQFRWIVTIQGGIDALFKDDPNVFVAGDLLWYPVKGKTKINVAPDVMVAFGRPKGKRGSYLQWQEANIAPQVVFEILSPGNTLTEMANKLKFYDNYGVEEYYIYDPNKKDLGGWIRKNNQLEVIQTINGWVSPRLGVRLEMGEEGLEIYSLDGRKFSTYIELDSERQLAEERAETERQRADRLAEKLRQLGIDPDTM